MLRLSTDLQMDEQKNRYHQKSPSKCACACLAWCEPNKPVCPCYSHFRWSEVLVSIWCQFIRCSHIQGTRFCNETEQVSWKNVHSSYPLIICCAHDPDVRAKRTTDSNAFLLSSKPCKMVEASPHLWSLSIHVYHVLHLPGRQ